MTDRLKSDLTAMAKEASTVDLRDRVLEGSRQLGFQRRVAACAAALVVLFAGAVGVAVEWGPITGDAAPPAQQTADPMTSTDPLAGDLYYQGPGGTGTDTDVVTLTRQRADGTVEEVYEASGVYSPMTVSPDGRYAAWSARDTDTGGYKLVLLDLATGDTRDLYSFDTMVSECPSPVWTTDAEPSILATDPHGGGDGLVIYEVETGRSRQSIWIPEDMRGISHCLPTGANDEFNVYFTVKRGAGSPPDLVKITGDGDVVSLDPLVHPAETFDLAGSVFTGMSPVGDQVCVQLADPDPGIHANDFPYCDLRMDMSGRLLTDPQERVSVLFLADSRFLSRHPDGTVTVTDARGKVVDSGTEAAAAQSLTMTAYVP